MKRKKPKRNLFYLILPALLLIGVGLYIVLHPREEPVKGTSFLWNGMEYTLYTKWEAETVPENLERIGILHWTKHVLQSDLEMNGLEAFDGAPVYISADHPYHAWVLRDETYYQASNSLNSVTVLRYDGDLFVLAQSPFLEVTPRFRAYLASLPDYSEEVFADSCVPDQIRQVRDEHYSSPVARLLRLQERDGRAEQIGVLHTVPGAVYPTEEFQLYTDPFTDELFGGEPAAGAALWAAEVYPNLLFVVTESDMVFAFWRYGELPPEGEAQ